MGAMRFRRAERLLSRKAAAPMPSTRGGGVCRCRLGYRYQPRRYGASGSGRVATVSSVSTVVVTGPAAGL